MAGHISGQPPWRQTTGVALWSWQRMAGQGPPHAPQGPVGGGVSSPLGPAVGEYVGGTGDCQAPTGGKRAAGEGYALTVASSVGPIVTAVTPLPIVTEVTPIVTEVTLPGQAVTGLIPSEQIVTRVTGEGYAVADGRRVCAKEKVRRDVENVAGGVRQPPPPPAWPPSGGHPSGGLPPPPGGFLGASLWDPTPPPMLPAPVAGRVVCSSANNTTGCPTFVPSGPIPSASSSSLTGLPWLRNGSVPPLPGDQQTTANNRSPVEQGIVPPDTLCTG